MARIRGITVILYEKTQTGENPLGEPIYEENPVEVENVLVSPASGSDLPEATNLDGRKAVYTLAIPKGDNHKWENSRVTFFGSDWKTFGFTYGGIDELIPLDWNKKIQVERYE